MKEQLNINNDATIYYEKYLLGSLLKGDQEFGLFEELVKSEYFYETTHKHIFSAMQIHVDQIRGEDINCKTFIEFPRMVQHLRWNDSLFPYALDLINTSMPSFLTLKEICELIRKDYQIRKAHTILEEGKATLRASNNLTESIGEIEIKLNEVVDEKVDKISTISTAISHVIDQEVAKLKENKNTFIESGFTEFDKTYGGFRPSDLIILAARPGMGKTAFATKIALNAAKKGTAVAFISLEMSKEQIGARILTIESNVSANKGLKFGLTNAEIERHVEVLKNLETLPFFIADTSGSTLADIRKKCFQLKKIHNIGMVIIDYLQIIQTVGKYSDSRVNLVGDISAGLKGLAKSLNVPVIALSQLSRGVESRLDKHPVLSDLRDSGSIEQDADVVMFLYRGEYYMPQDESLKGRAELSIAKHRHDVLSRIGLRFISSTTDFQSL